MKLTTRRKIVTVLLAGAMLAGGATAGLAAESAARVIAERQAVMKMNGGNFLGIKSSIAAGDAKAVAAAAGAIAAMAPFIPSLFPKGTGPEAGKTKALAKIWEDGDGFKKAAEKLAAEAGALAKVAAGGDMKAISAQFAKMGKQGCGGCHGTYRAK
jgi:cytochrome c556